MGSFDEIKGKIGDVVEKAKDVVTDDKIDSVVEAIKDKTPDQVDSVVDKVAEAAKKLND